QLIDQGDGRAARQQGVEIHLLKNHAAVLDAPPRQLLQVADQGGGVGPAVRLDDADNDVNPLLLEPLALLEHLEGLADAGGETEVDLEPAALLVADQAQEVLGGWPLSVGRHAKSPLLFPLPCTRGAGVRGWSRSRGWTVVGWACGPPHPRPLSPEYR